MSTVDLRSLYPQDTEGAYKRLPAGLDVLVPWSKTPAERRQLQIEAMEDALRDSRRLSSSRPFSAADHRRTAAMLQWARENQAGGNRFPTSTSPTKPTSAG